jgi:predicted RNA binding protein YcfA (HicA-like mRNA interferase family)
MKVRAVIRGLEQDGWYLVRTSGSHRRDKHASRRGLVTVPGEPAGELAPGTLHCQKADARTTRRVVRGGER